MHCDRFHCTDADVLLRWMLRDLEQGEIFGIAKQLFFMPKVTDAFRMRRYGVEMETPLGVAAGPHTQLAQNILAAWLTGGRYIELKTIQVLDELTVSKPCIDMTDEGYNCEWSQELKLEQSYNEYLKAWVLMHIMRHRLDLPGPGPGFIFNMSAGYNLEGIKSPTVQKFLDRMGNSEADVKALQKQLAEIYPAAADLNIPGIISSNLTISCMHGCPPDEVEKIALYFIEERKFNTTIKLNPTLLGPDRLREILNKKLGYSVTVPDEAFGHDLRYEDGVKIIKSCVAAAKKVGVDFSIKLTNTLETSNEKQNLPKHEKMVYMSGRSLHAISINLAARLQKEFAGSLDISFSAGVDAFNVFDTLCCGLKPITVCSDLLKPGGYGRLSQYTAMLTAEMRKLGAKNIEEAIKLKAGKEDLHAAIVSNLEKYAAEVADENSRYGKKCHCYPTVKTKRPLPRFDCAGAPCKTACPASQDIPRYLDFVHRGQPDKALATIMATIPFPNVQGKVCDHQCYSKCTRLNYDRPLLIREIKRYASEKSQDLVQMPKPAQNSRVAVIGAGPSGLSAAHYLALAGCEVNVYEAKGFPGGMAADAIPAFRLDDSALQKDIGKILELGVRLHTSAKIDADKFAALRRNNDFIYLAIGAQKSLPLGIPGEDAEGVLDQLTFLSNVRQGKPNGLGKKTLVIGAGNSAMDAARTARRLGSEVTIVYRRTCAEMPCDPEELTGALEEGVKLVELSAPSRVVVENGKVAGLDVCPMKLECSCDGGRPRPVACGDPDFRLEADSIVVAIGQKIDLDFLPASEDLRALFFKNIFVGGDAARGASTLIRAIADGRHVAEAILFKAGKAFAHAAPLDDRKPDYDFLRVLQARRNYGPGLNEVEADKRINFDLFVKTMSDQNAKAETGRCLQCDIFCNVCATVCPNRANIALKNAPFSYVIQEAVLENDALVIKTLSEATARQAYQIVNLADACNECGNCATFCPTSGAPYKDKVRMHLSKTSFEEDSRGYFLAAKDKLEGVRGKSRSNLTFDGVSYTYEDEQVKAQLDSRNLAALKVELKGGATRFDLSIAAEMAMVYRLVADRAPFAG